jgi:Gpi18-like mannosyltransferase
LSKAHWVLSTRDATRLQSPWALGLCLLMICSGLLALPFMATPAPRLDSFLLIIETALATLSLVVALLLYAQFARARTPSLLALAGGFLFVALTTLSQLLRLSQGGIIHWQLQFATDLALPLAVIAYALLRRVEHLADFEGDRAAAFIGRSVAAVFLLAALAIGWAASGDRQTASPENDLSSSVKASSPPASWSS